MRNNEERVAAAMKRANELKFERQKRRYRILRLSLVSLCFAVIIGLSLAMPGIVGSFSNDDPIYSDTTASVFYDSGALGYIVIGILAFSLGVCVTLLCHHTRQAENEEKAEKKHRENDDD